MVLLVMLLTIFLVKPRSIKVLTNVLALLLHLFLLFNFFLRREQVEVSLLQLHLQLFKILLKVMHLRIHFRLRLR